MKKLLFGAVALLSFGALAQSLIINMKNGDITKVPIADIASLSFKDSPVQPNVPLSVFTDPILQNAVAKAAFGDDAEGKTELTPADLAKVTSINLNYTDVASLEGIENLTELTELMISGCEKLTTVDLSGLEKLQELYASMCTSLETLTLGNKPALKEIYAYNNTSLTSMDFAGLTAIESCAVYGAKIPAIEIHSESLTSLNCGNASLETVDLNGCDNLTTLNLDNAPLSEFSISEFSKLEEFSLQSGKLKSFTTEGCKELKKLILNFNTSLTKVNVSKSMKLNTLSCSSCFYYGEEGEVTMTEGQEIATMNGVQSWMIKRVPREWPDDVAPELSDEAFRNAMIDAADKDGDGKISKEEAEAVTEINASGLGLTSVDFTWFNNITSLDLSDNELTSLDLSSTPNLTYLNVNNNKIASLDLSTVKLQYLYANNNELTTIGRFNGYAYIEVELANNKLTAVSLMYQGNLVKVDVSHNEITNADIRENAKLAYMDVSYNQIKSMTIWSLKKLVNVNFSNNPFTQLNEADRWTILETIDCSNTDITTLNLSQTTELKKCVATDCANLETIYVAEGSDAEIVKGDNTNVVYGAPAAE
ncbi:MAG: leucine-rich repeat domain-containing protein [Muribaculaceae bacterium]|nr:leucine-rich repeat domain-containing protein [Muribaculaceae bacterium]